MDWSILSSYTFWVVAVGTMILALASGMVSCVSVAKGQALIGDAIGHASYPGIILAYMFFLTREPLVLLGGAAVAAALAWILIQIVPRYSHLHVDTALAVILSGFFGIGMVFKSYVAGHPAYASASQAGLDNYLFGQAAYLRIADVKMLVVVALVSLLLLALFYKEFKLFIFDPGYCHITPFKPFLLNILLLVMTLSLIVAGLKLVGFLLIATFLVLPALIARQWSVRFGVNIAIAGVSALISAFLGSAASSLWRGVSTGPAIILIMAVFLFASMALGPCGQIRVARAQRRAAKKLEQGRQTTC